VLHGSAAGLGKAAAALVARSRIKRLPPGSFSIVDWTGYPESLPKPNGPFRLLEGAEYEAARDAANDANRALHRKTPSLTGKHFHENHPVKFGGESFGFDLRSGAKEVVCIPFIGSGWKDGVRIARTFTKFLEVMSTSWPGVLSHPRA
jgi:hypothetical protein